MLALSYFLSFLLAQSFYPCQVRPTKAASQLASSIFLPFQKQEIELVGKAQMKSMADDDDWTEEDKTRRQDKHLITMET